MPRSRSNRRRQLPTQVVLSPQVGRASRHPQASSYDRRRSAAFLVWCWCTGYGEWMDGVRCFGRMLKGLRGAGWIEPLTASRKGGRRFRLTRQGREALGMLVELNDREV